MVLSEFRAFLSTSLPPSLRVYNAGDYAEGRSRPSGRLARCTYKGAIEMCSHSESQGRQAGRPAGGRAGEALHPQLLGEDKGGSDEP